MLASGPQPTKEVEAEAKVAGLSLATLRRAKEGLKVRVRKEGFQGQWVWELPKDAHEAKGAQGCSKAQDEHL